MQVHFYTSLSYQYTTLNNSIYQYTAAVSAIQASVSIIESDAISCRCDPLITLSSE